ncbi:hypothetical protein BDZ94DRAFT_1310443 [Collybia nuda]|uniref:Uncharacterized protein n=1 Tax=Collybia nuda TaxID=64659 RepID=A0A9P6CDB2_9AGAR|nr:hypothetical protein BDZ94DRAFT_1310443 [Collybia nuda]
MLERGLFEENGIEFSLEDDDCTADEWNTYIGRQVLAWFQERPYEPWGDTTIEELGIGTYIPSQNPHDPQSLLPDFGYKSRLNGCPTFHQTAQEFEKLFSLSSCPNLSCNWAISTAPHPPDSYR